MTVSFPRLTLVELRKMVDTRAGFWLQLSVAALTLIVVAALCIFGDPDDLIFRDLLALATFPASILLPIVGILLVSSEWSQRTALITFTLVPRRMRVMGAKIAASLVLGALVLALAIVVAAVATVAVGGEWTLGAVVFQQIALLCGTSILTGVAFGSAFLSSAPAIVLYFVLPFSFAALGSIPFLNDAAQWLDVTRTTSDMTDRALTGHEWAQFATSQAVWLVLPLAIGLFRITRGEIRAA
jgi:ABC-type transport system involved in multi-copper enzyme maturation permease subunit